MPGGSTDRDTPSRHEVIPKSLRLEASTVCQLRCPSCPTGQGALRETLRNGFLEPDAFEDLLAANPDIRHVELSNWGESLLNKKLPDILRSAHENGIRITFENGVNLNNASEEVLEALVKYRVRHVVCAIDGASPETYEIYRVGGDFNRVIENIKRINHFKGGNRWASPWLTWQFIIFGHNEHEIPKARNLARELGMSFITRLSWDADFSPIRNHERVKEETGHAVTDRREFGEKYQRPYRHRSICSQLWNEPQVNWDGRVLGCCVNHWGDFGNAFESGLGTVLNGSRMRRAREMVLGRRGPDADVPCTSCPTYENMKAHDSFLTMRDVGLVRLASSLRRRSSLLTRIGVRLYSFFIRRL